MIEGSKEITIHKKKQQLPSCFTFQGERKTLSAPITKIPFAYAHPTLLRVFVFLKFCFYELKATSARTSLKRANVD